MASPAIVTAVTGHAWILNRDGSRIELHPGSQVPPGSEIVTAADSQVQMTVDGKPVVIGAGREVAFSGEMAAPVHDASQSHAHVPNGTDSDRLLQALNNHQDPLAHLPVAGAVGGAAAGGAATGSSDAGFVVLDRISLNTTPLGWGYPSSLPTVPPLQVPVGQDQNTTLLAATTTVTTPTAVNDLPTSGNATHDTSLTPVNVMMVLDFSQSMHGLGDFAPPLPETRLLMMEQSVANLMIQYQNQGSDVNMQFVAFGQSGAHSSVVNLQQLFAALEAAHPGSPVTATDLMNWMNGQSWASSSNVGGNATNYETALTDANALWNSSGGLQTAGHTNVVYFMSDGVPNTGNDSSILTVWDATLTNNHITSWAVGVGVGADLGSLTAIANGTTVISLTDPSDTLSWTLPSGSALAPEIQSSIFAETDTTGAYVNASIGSDTTGAAISILAANNPGDIINTATVGEIQVTTAHGVFTIYTETENGHNFGDYTYTATSATAYGTPDTITYTLADGNGDSAHGTVSFNVADLPTDHVLTNATASSVPIDGMALLASDGAVNSGVLGEQTGHTDGSANPYATTDGHWGYFTATHVDGQTVTADQLNGEILQGNTQATTMSGLNDDGHLSGAQAVTGNVFVSESGNDTMNGNLTGHDTFVLNLDHVTTTGTDVINNFQAGSGASGDVLDLSEVLNVDHSNAASAFTLSESGGNTTISFTANMGSAVGQTQSIELHNVSIAQLNSAYGIAPGTDNTHTQLINDMMEQGKLHVTSH